MLKDNKIVAKLPKDARFTLGGPNLYYRNEGIIEYISLNKDKSYDSGNKKDAHEKHLPWSNGESIFYSDNRSVCHLITSVGEMDLSRTVACPDKVEGFVCGDYLVSSQSDKKELQVVDLKTGGIITYDLEKELAQYMSSSDSSDIEKAAEYDIAEGMTLRNSNDDSEVYINLNGAILTMPNNKKWGIEQTEKGSVRIFLYEAQKEGYGGNLVTIKAYDMNDSSYEKLSSYNIAGSSKKINKMFLAVYPTDVQWNNNDTEQTADYIELQEYLRKIGEESGSPFRITDED